MMSNPHTASDKATLESLMTSSMVCMWESLVSFCNINGVGLKTHWSTFSLCQNYFSASMMFNILQGLQIIAFSAHAIIKHTIYVVLPDSCRYSVFVNTALLWNIVSYAVLTFSLLSFAKSYIVYVVIFEWFYLQKF